MIAYTITDKNISIFLNGKMHQVNKSHAKFNEIYNFLKENRVDYDELESMMNYVAKAVAAVSQNRVTIKGHTIFMDDQPMHDYFGKKMSSLLLEGFGIDPWINFLKKIMNNPSENSRKCLFEFLDKNNSPITPDGNFIAFKRVTSDFKDIYSKTFDNSVGKTVEVDRSKVDSNINNTCSYGLHVAASSYLNNYARVSGSRTIFVEVDPADVVAVPPDYKQTKMRVSKYVVKNALDNVKIDEQMKTTEQQTIVGKSEAAKNELKVSNIVSNKKEENIDMKFTATDGRIFTPAIIKAGINTAGSVAAYAKSVKVPESTMRGWKKKADNAISTLVFIVPSTGSSVAASSLLLMVEQHGVSKAARELKAGETTVRNWIKKARVA